MSLVISSDADRFRWRAEDVEVFELANGWRERVVRRPNGVTVHTILDADGVPIRRWRVLPDGREVTLFNNLPGWWDEASVVIREPLPVVRERIIIEPSRAPVQAVYDAVVAEPQADLNRTYTLNQILANEGLRAVMPRIDVDTITFATGSAEVPETQIDALEAIGVAIETAVQDDPAEVFLVEGHTDAVGSELSNLELSDRRATSVAQILTEFFEIPPENLVTQGFGEAYLKVATQGASQENRRVTLRRITPLLSTEDRIAGLADEGVPQRIQ
ncbi:MAG: OmpA family protein [Pseudomonadota bacterium]